MFTFPFTVHLPNKEVDIAETFVVEKKLGSFSDGWSGCLQIFFGERHDSDWWLKKQGQFASVCKAKEFSNYRSTKRGRLVATFQNLNISGHILLYSSVFFSLIAVTSLWLCELLASFLDSAQGKSVPDFYPRRTVVQNEIT